MKTYIITRFSIFDYNHHAFKIQCKCNRQGYKSRLFSPKRLRHKFNVFEKMTLPSIINQTNTNWVWYIYASSHMPEEFKSRLISLTKSHSQIRCKFIDSFAEFVFAPDKEDINSYCTMRLDDDDGISANFVEKLQKYKDKKGYIITHKCGINFSIVKKKIVYGNEVSYRMGGVGLTVIGDNIYDCGHHMRLKSNYREKIICDDTPKMFYLCCGDYCDSGRTM